MNEISKNVLRRLTAALYLFIAAQAFGQEPQVLTVEQSVAIGLKNSRALHASLMKTQGADARSSEVHASLLPSLKLGGAYTRLSDVPSFEATIPAGVFGPNLPPQTVSFPLSQTIVNNYSLRLTLQQPLFTGFRLKAGADMAEYAAQATAEEYNRDKTELVYSIESAYWSLFKANEFKKVIDENVEQVKSHLSDVQNLMKQGMATNNDLLRVEVQLSNVQLLQIDANNNVHLGMIALNNVMGQPIRTEIQLASVPSAADTQYAGADINKLTDAAAETRYEVKAMRYRIDAAEAGVTAARSGWFPQVYLSGNYYYARPNQRIVPTVDQFKDTWDVSVTASLDIWNWGTTIHQTQQAQAQLAQTEDILGQLRDAIVLEVTQNYLNLRQARERITVADQAVKQADENHRVTNEKFKQGLALNSDLLDAEVALLQAKTSFTQALVDYELAQARLRKSIGNN